MSSAVPARGRRRAPRIALLVAAFALGLVLVLLSVVLPRVRAAEADPWSATSPDGRITVRLLQRDGELTLAVGRRGRPVLDASLGRAGDLAGARVAHRDLDERFGTPAGKRRVHRLHARLLTLTLAGRRTVEVLAGDDGVAFRQRGFGAQPAGWHAPRDARAWLQAYRPDYEGAYRPTTLGAAGAGDYGFPALLQTRAAGGTWALLTESGLPAGAAAARLAVSAGHPGELAITLPQGERPTAATSWRVAVLGDLATIVGSDLPLALGRPSQIADPSWIRPGRVAWSWWSDSTSPGDLERQRAYVRAAAAAGWEYVLLDAGWKPEWAPDLVRYAARMGVRIIVWTSWDQIASPADRERLLGQWASWGVAGVKVDFLLSDSAARMAVYDDIARAAARHRLLVAFHGCTLPRGIERTWPNVLTLEAVRGAEHEKTDMEGESVDPAHDVDLAFTRNVVGSMDYTPVTFSAPSRATTLGHRLALGVVFESGLQHFADSPEVYAEYPTALRMLADMPVAWDDTRLVSGAPDRDVTIARRSHEDWWIGSVAAGEARRQTVPLRFLAPGQRYRAHVVRDDGAGGLVVDEPVVTARDRLWVDVARNGGFAAHLTPLP